MIQSFTTNILNLDVEVEYNDETNNIWGTEALDDYLEEKNNKLRDNARELSDDEIDNEMEELK